MFIVKYYAYDVMLILSEFYSLDHRPCHMPGEEPEINVGHQADPYRGPMRVHSEVEKPT
jgi:hypothetical protein